MWFVWVMWGIVTISIIATIILMTGKGSKFVTGFNTKSTEERADSGRCQAFDRKLFQTERKSAAGI